MQNGNSFQKLHLISTYEVNKRFVVIQGESSQNIFPQDLLIMCHSEKMVVIRTFSDAIYVQRSFKYFVIYKVYHKLIVYMTDSKQITEIKQGFTTLYTALIKKFRDPTIDSIPSNLLVDINKKVRDESEGKRVNETKPNANKINLHEAFSANLKLFYQEVIIPNFKSAANASQSDFVDQTIRNWDFVKIFALTYKFVLQTHQKFYEQSYKLRLHNHSVATCVLNLFRDKILTAYREKFTQIILQTLEKERNLEKTEKEKLKTIFEIIETCGYYEHAAVESSNRKSKTIAFKRLEVDLKNDKAADPNHTPAKYFEEYIFKVITSACASSYNKRASTLSESPFQYITQASQIIRSEAIRVEYYLFDAGQMKEYLEVVDKELIDNKLEEIVSKQSGINKFLQENNQKAITGLYSLAKRRKVKTYPIIDKELRAFIVKKGNEITKEFLLAEKKDAIKYIDDMVNLKKKINEIVEKYLSKEMQFCKLRDTMFREILKIESLEGSKRIEFLASKNLVQYTDKKIKQCYKINQQKQRQDLINNIILICQSLTAIDVYLLQHQKQISKRMLETYTGKPSVEVERMVIGKLKNLVGPEEVRDHQRMLADLENSEAQEKLVEQQLKDSDFRTNLQILTNSAWPENEDVDIAFPNCLVNQKSILQAYYAKKNPGKCLKWILNRGVSVVEAKLVGTYKLTVSNIMMLILMHIYETKSQKILYGDLKQKFKLRRIKNEEDNANFDSEFRVNLMTLVQNKILLRSKDKAADISIDEEFAINKQYVFVPPASKAPVKKPGGKGSENTAISITIIPSAKLQQLYKPTNDALKQVRQIRNMRMSAVIVQVMKNTKTITFENLTNELRKHPRLNGIEFTINQLKQRLQKLITDQYCERDENDRNLLFYKP